MHEVLLSIKQVRAIAAVSRRTVYRWMEAGQFPRHTRIGANSVRWRKSDIDKWVADKFGEEDQNNEA